MNREKNCEELRNQLAIMLIELKLKGGNESYLNQKALLKNIKVVGLLVIRDSEVRTTDKQTNSEHWIG